MLRGSSQVQAGVFRYIPSEKGLVASDQFQKASGAIGEMHTPKPVSELIKAALTKHLVAAGFSNDVAGGLVVDGEIQKFLYDWIGFSEVNFYLDIDFRIKSGDSVIFEYKARAHQKAPKTAAMAQDPEAVKAAIAECFDSLLSEARAKKVL
jgi:hypothetical protein